MINEPILSFNEFCQIGIFANKCKNSNFYDFENQELIKRLNGFQNFQWLCIRLKCIWNKNNPNELYLDFLNFIEKTIQTQKLCGVGYHGLVFYYENNKVIKILDNDFPFRNNDKDVKFLMDCYNNWETNKKSKILPHIYKTDFKHYIVMERFDINTKLCQKWVYESTKEIGQTHRNIIDYVILGKESANTILSLLNNFQKKVYFWHKRMFNIFKHLDIEYPGDFNINNIGQRLKTNDIIYFDI